VIHLAACAAGFGGLLIEMVLVRRHGLLLGNTAESAALVVALFLAGLGLGGLSVPRITASRRRAALLYACVAFAAPCCDAVLRHVGPVPWPAGVGLALLAPGALAVAMGAAFPLLFACIPPGRRASGALVASNLFGSVAAAWWGGNRAIPELGATATLWLGAAAYALAAVALYARRDPRRDAPAPRHRLRWGAAAAPAFCSGVLLLGLEVLLLRRLPFWLEGLQPTLAGVLATCLLGATTGALLLPLAVRARRHGGGAHAALALGGVLVAAGLHEAFAPAISRWAIESELGMHLRIAAAAAAGALPCLLLGGVVPLCAARLRDPAMRSVLAGRLYFWQGLGGLCGALLAGSFLPALFPAAYFAVAPPALAALALLTCVRGGGASVRLACALAVLAALAGGPAGSPWAPAPALAGARYDRPHAFRYLAQASDSGVVASAVYDQSQHSMVLFTDGFRAAETGPGTAYMRALGHLPMLLAPHLRRIAVIALGTGTTADAVAMWRDPEAVDVVEISPAVLALAPYFGGDGPAWNARGPLPFARDPRTRVHLADGRRFLALRPPQSLDLITLEPLLPYAPATTALYSGEFYELVRRALAPGGLAVQWVPTHAMPGDYFDTLLATFARTFPCCSVWLVDQATILVGSAEPHLPAPAALAARYEALPAPLREALHACGLARPVDVQVALVGDGAALARSAAPSLTDDRPFLERVGYWSGARKLGFSAENLARLRAVAEEAPDDAWTDASWRAVRARRLEGLLEMARAPLLADSAALGLAVRALATARAAEPDSVLLHREETAALRALLEREASGRNDAAIPDAARLHLRRDLRSQLLLALVALNEGDPRLAAAALALDPGWRSEAPELADQLALLAAPADRFELADVAALPEGDALLELALANEVAAAVLAAVHPVPLARACVARIAQRPLTDVEAELLLPALDPLSLSLAADAVAARAGNPREVLRLWRTDLPMPQALVAAARDPGVDKVALAHGLRGHRGAHERAVLADLLMDERREVRDAAGITLRASFGDRVPYDPLWEESRRRVAADQLRAMHNP
jgi:spermidine synthase